jgi:heme/copper-type cytochrome/quinol oxidase subunit 2
MEEKGESSQKGDSSCTLCDLGRFQTTPGDCTLCAAGRYQDGKGEKSCKQCEKDTFLTEEGKSSKADCIKAKWKVSTDCHTDNQYLNTSSSNKMNHTCASCPLGALCKGDITWANVTAKSGWWRIEDHKDTKDKLHPPKCLEEHEGVKPPCAFVKCFEADACKYTFTAFESCNHNDTLEKGYSNNCTDHNYTTNKLTPSRCRLCATCAPGYKHTGSGSECQKCPSSATNKAWLALGFFILIIGSTIMIYMEINSETSKDDSADAVKKILLNFLQIVSLAALLPLQWPQPIEDMFYLFGTISSAGTTLLVPDCELSHLRAAEAFYLKQWFFTFMLPMIAIVCVLVWTCLYLCCHKKFKNNIKDYTILSIVLLFFLCYPTIVKVSFSMLRCPWVNTQMYLMADMQEKCFEGAHFQHLLMLTIPQIILYIIGLPLVGTMHLMRNKDQLHEKHFYTRYGLLYLGYRDDRAWWELVVAIRKVCVVAIGTFGTLLGVVDIQAHLALLVVFLSIAAHLYGQPFDMERKNSKLLFDLELTGLGVCWFTFWGGLLFFLGHEKKDSVNNNVKIMMTIMLMVANMTFLIYASWIFAREYRKDKEKEKERKSTFNQTAENLSNGQQKTVRIKTRQIDGTKVAPIDQNGLAKEEEENIAVRNWETKPQSKPVSTVVGTKSSLAITAVMLMVGNLVVGVAEGTSVLERGDVVGSSLIAFDTTTPVWNERVDDRYCVVKEINRYDANVNMKAVAVEEVSNNCIYLFLCSK